MADIYKGIGVVGRYLPIISRLIPLLALSTCHGFGQVVWNLLLDSNANIVSTPFVNEFL